MRVAPRARRRPLGHRTRSRRRPPRPARSGSSCTAARRSRACRSSSTRSRASSSSGSSGSPRSATWQIVNYGSPGKPTAFALLELERTIERARSGDRALPHNEFLGWKAPSASKRFRRPLRGWLDATATARAAAAAGSAGLARRAARPTTSSCCPSGSSPSRPRERARFASASREFERATRAIAALARERGVPLIFATDSANLADWPPVWRFVRDERYERGVSEQCARSRARRARRGRGRLAALTAEYPGDAMGTWLGGRLALARGDWPRARASVRRGARRRPGSVAHALASTSTCAGSRAAATPARRRRRRVPAQGAARGWSGSSGWPTTATRRRSATRCSSASCLRVMAEAKLGIASLDDLPPLVEQADLFVREAQPRAARRRELVPLARERGSTR